MHTSAVLARWNCLTRSVYHSGFMARTGGGRTSGDWPAYGTRPVPRPHGLPPLPRPAHGSVPCWVLSESPRHLEELHRSPDVQMGRVGHPRPAQFLRRGVVVPRTPRLVTSVPTRSRSAGAARTGTWRPLARPPRSGGAGRARGLLQPDRRLGRWRCRSPSAPGWCRRFGRRP